MKLLGSYLTTLREDFAGRASGRIIYFEHDRPLNNFGFIFDLDTGLFEGGPFEIETREKQKPSSAGEVKKRQKLDVGIIHPNAKSYDDWVKKHSRHPTYKLLKFGKFKAEGHIKATPSSPLGRPFLDSADFKFVTDVVPGLGKSGWRIQGGFSRRGEEVYLTRLK